MCDKSDVRDGMCIVGADMPVGKQMAFEPLSTIEGILGDISAASMGGKEVAMSEKKKFVHAKNKGVPMTPLQIAKCRRPKTTFTHKNAAGSGGREQKPDPFAMRQIMVVLVHHDGLFKEMWDIQAQNSIVTAQYVKLYAAFTILCDICPVEYVASPMIGHPWFGIGNKAYLNKISISMEQYICLWTFVCAKNSKQENMQTSVNKIMLSVGLSQQVIKDTHVEFTFKAALWQKNAPSMMHGGKGGGGKNVDGRLKLGRPTIQAMYNNVAQEGAVVTAMTPIQMRAPKKLIAVESTIHNARDFFKNATTVAPSPILVAAASVSLQLLAAAAATLTPLPSPIPAVPPVEYKVW